MDLDFGTFFLLVLLLLAPAVIVLIIATVIRVRRSRFHRQRITKNSSRREKE